MMWHEISKNNSSSKLKGALLLLTACLTIGMAAAQAGPPKMEVKFKEAKGAAGSELKGEVTLTFSPGWHGYANPPSSEFNIPVVVKSGSKEFKMVKVMYPKGTEKEDPIMGGTTAIYEGMVKIPFIVKLPDKTGKTDLKITVSYQQCDESSCLPPDEISKTVKVEVTEKAAEAPKEEGQASDGEGCGCGCGCGCGKKDKE